MPKIAPEKLEARRRQILTAAVECFVRNGFHQTTMADIAAEAGVSDTLAYRYFSDKDDIISAAMQEGIQPDARAGEPIEGEDPVDAWQRLLGTSFERFDLPSRSHALRMRAGAWSRAFDDEEVLAGVRARWANAIDFEASLWERAKRDGLVREDLDPAAIGTVMQAIHDGLDLMWAHDPDIDLAGCRRVIEALTLGTFWQGRRSQGGGDEEEGRDH